MWTILVVIVLVCFILLLFGFMMMRKKSDSEQVNFICTDCGEKDCICHREDGDLG